jgi:hypothetical protein
MLSAATLAALDGYASRFRTAEPFRHVVMDGFLEAETARRLLQTFPRFDTRFALNEMGKPGGKAVRMRVRELGPGYAALDDYLQTSAFLSAVSRITGIPDLLYDPDYEGGGTHENLHGQSLDPHVDFNYHPRTGWHRRLNLIVYLNPEWEGAWGGNLKLQRNPWEDRSDEQVVAPLFNRCVIFETNEVSWHGFDAIDLPADRREVSRRSFAIYLYTRDRPASETAPPHATVYVPQGMPPEIPVGTIIDEAVHLRLRANFARLRAQLRFLYERETGFARRIQDLEYALAEARGAAKIDLQGYARQTSVSGYWPDGWCGTEVVLVLEPARPIKAVILEVWTPEGLGQEQVIRACLGAEQVELRVDPGARRSLRFALRAAAGGAVTLSLRSESCWTPSSTGASGDDRPLAFRLFGAVLEH